MLINSLKINNLRNIEKADISPHPRLNFLIGDNGAGKTSVLESLVVLAKGKSFRAGQVSALVGPTQSSFMVVANTQSDHGKQTLGMERSPDSWRARHNGQDVKLLGALAAELPFVLIEPMSHQLVSGSPDYRRKYLDWGVFHVEHEHLVRWRRYTRAMKQRNAALRQQRGDMAQALEQQLAELGTEIDRARSECFTGLLEIAESLKAALCPDLGEVTIRYYRGWKDEPLADALASTLGRDLERGATGPGPHRADLMITSSGKLARERLSRGEQKILSSAMILAQAQQISQSGQVPMLLLDDLASEFDTAHLRAVLELGAELNAQIWITGTSLEPYAYEIVGAHKLFHVEHGKITEKTGA